MNFHRMLAILYFLPESTGGEDKQKAWHNPACLRARFFGVNFATMSIS